MKPSIALEILRRERIALDDELRSMSYNAHPTVRTIEYARALTTAIEAVGEQVQAEKDLEGDTELDLEVGKDRN